jgi:hypothetical protein
MNLLTALLVGMVFAAEGIISPLPDNFQNIEIKTENNNRPAAGFLKIEINNPKRVVLGAQTGPASPSAKFTRKDNIKIALLGDSMTDTLGPDAIPLRDALKNIYPKTNFTIINNGVGGTNSDYGLLRVTQSYNYLGNHIPSLISTNPDLVIIESFGYNPFSYDIGALDHEWLTLDAIVKTIKHDLPETKIMMASTIAPNSNVFGDGAAGLKFSHQDKVERTTNIKKYLENALRYAKSQNIPAADAYHPSLDASANGKIEYINPGDHIHYSDTGREFYCQILARTIIENGLLE